MRIFFFSLIMLTANAAIGDVFVGHPGVKAKLAIKAMEAKKSIDDWEQIEACHRLFLSNKWLMEYPKKLYRYEQYPSYVGDPRAELSNTEMISLQRARNNDCFTFLSIDAISDVSLTAPSTIIFIE